MIRLNRDRKLVKWAYLGSACTIPKTTTICVLFWRIVLVSPTACLFVAVLFPLWGPILFWTKYCEKPFLRWRELRKEAYRERRLVAYERRLAKDRMKGEPSVWSVLGSGLKTIKGKVCPIVELVDLRESNK